MKCKGCGVEIPSIAGFAVKHCPACGLAVEGGAPAAEEGVLDVDTLRKVVREEVSGGVGDFFKKAGVVNMEGLTGLFFGRKKK